MAKDGTNRGGARPGAGRPRKALAEKLAEGQTAEVMMQPADIESADTPPVFWYCCMYALRLCSEAP